MMTFNTIPLSVSSILKTLRDSGYESYLVGGCVRDILLGREPHDYDVTTNATPDQVEQIFSHTIPTGKQYGTITVIWNSEDGMEEQSIEVTTFRKDSPTYSDGRRPDYVEFGTSLKEDVERRDFTINALAWSSETGIVDYVNGVTDLTNNIIRTVGDPYKRFEEDALRTVRCIRFATKYNFAIEKETRKALIEMIKNKNCLQYISKERIHDEIYKILPYYEATYDWSEIDLEMFNCFAMIFNSYGFATFTDRSKYNLKYRLYELYNHYIDRMKDLKFSNEDIKYVTDMDKCNYDYHDFYDRASLPYKVRVLISRYEDNIVQDFLIYHEQIDVNTAIILVNEALNHCLNLDSLKIDGNDLLKFGYKGKEIGKILNKCLEKVLEHPENNNREWLLSFAYSNCIIN